MSDKALNLAFSVTATIVIVWSIYVLSKII